MNTQVLKCLALVPFVWSCNKEGRSEIKPDVLQDDLKSKTQDAHQSYLDRDYEKMLGEVKQVLQSPTAPTYMKDNVLQLTEKAVTETRGDLPVDWTVPSEITKLRVNVERRDRGTRVAYQFSVRCAEASKGLIKGLQIIKFPSQVILDKEANVGTVDSHFEPSDGNYYFELENDETDKPVESGLYLLKMTLTNGKQVDGWFPLSNHVSTGSPEVLSPSRGQTFTTSSPMFRWKDFVSTIYQPYEFRHLSVFVSRSEPPDYNWEPVSEFYEDDPTTTERSSEKTLENGRYINNIIYREGHKFGPMRILRASSTIRHFFVKASQ